MYVPYDITIYFEWVFALVVLDPVLCVEKSNYFVKFFYKVIKKINRNNLSKLTKKIFFYSNEK